MAKLNVKYAVYGALPGGQSNNAKAFDVTQSLQKLIDANAGVVSCDNTSFGDPSPGNDKHFGALVNRDGTDVFFACHEGQKVDFNHDGGAPAAQSGLRVKFAVYGALSGGVLSEAQGADVGEILQSRLDLTGGLVVCGNETFGDPSPGNVKHFAAVITRNGQDLHFACAEGQTINFSVGGT